MILVDANALIYQVYHATSRSGMSTASGLPTNALFGFTRDLLFLRAMKPAYLIVACDVSEKTFRNDLYPAYKAHREPMPADLVIQLPLIHKIMEALSIPTLGMEGFEADDLLATVSKSAGARGLNIWICTSDKDCRQLIDERIQMYNLRKRQVFGRAELLEDWGITPEQVVDLQILVGDSVDNVPGVPGVGVKTAAKLLQEFGTLENLLAHVDEVPGKKQESIKAASVLFDMSRRLVRLVTDAPVKFDWDAWRLQPINSETALKLFQEWGFQTFARQVREGTADTNGSDQPGLFDGPELFPFGANVAPNGDTKEEEKLAEWKAKYHLVDTPEEFERFFGLLNVQKRFDIDLETTGLDPLRCELVGLAFCWKEGEAYYLAVKAPAGEKHLDAQTTLARLKPLLEDPRVEKVNQNIKYDQLVLRAHGINLRGVTGDSMVADYLLHAGEQSHGLKDLSVRLLGHEMTPIKALIGKKSKKQPELTMDQVSTQRVADYAAADADVSWRLTGMLESQLESVSREPGLPSLRKLYEEVEIPLIGVLAAMEFNGVRLDVPRLRALSVEMGKQLAEIETEIYRLAGHPFKIGSLPQLRTVLFDELKLPKQRTTGVTGAASTDQETLEKLAAMTKLPGHLLPKKILEYRQVSKLKSTYVDALPEMLNPNTGRVHASFNQTVASTGRLSCLPGDTLVNTHLGLVKIENVRPGDLVHTPFGSRKVLEWEATGSKPVCVLRFSNGLTLRCSAEHRLRSKGEWVKAGQLQLGAPVYMSFQAGLFGKKTELSISPTAAYTTRKTPQLPVSWSKEFAELTGYLMADGHVVHSNYNGKPSKVVLAFGWQDDELIEHFRRIIRELFSKEPVYRVTRTCPVLELSGVDIAGAFEQLGAGGKSADIRVPPSLFQAPEAIVAGFLRGYFEGDGCVGPDAGIQVRSVSQAMLEQVQQLLTLFGIPSTVKKGTADPRGYAARYTLKVRGDRSKRIFHTHIGFLSSRKSRACSEFNCPEHSESTAETLTLPDDFDCSALKPAIYGAYRDRSGNVPQAVATFASKLVRRATRKIKLSRAESIVRAPAYWNGWDEESFLSEAVRGQYCEITLTEIGHEPPQPMYDIAVEQVEQYFAQGILVHNSSTPNLQNIPVRREMGQQIRQAFIAEEGWRFLTADYSQIELRLFAHFCGDEAMRQAFAEGRDIHTAVAAQINSVAPDQVTSEMRRVAKTVNFGVIYGMSAHGLAERLHISREDAAKFIGSYFARYPRVLEYQQKLLENCRKAGYVSTILGRRRAIEGIRGVTSFDQRNQPEREAINMEIQGSAADLIKLAMLNLFRRLQREKMRSRLLLQIHDELVFESPPDELPALAAMVRDEMTTPLEKTLRLQVPLEVDMSQGPNWLDTAAVDGGGT